MPNEKENENLLNVLNLPAGTTTGVDGSDTFPVTYNDYMKAVETIASQNIRALVSTNKLENAFYEYDINDGGLKINDQPVWLTGYAQRSTNEWAVIGVANDWLQDLDMQWIKESNSNFIRWMHVAPKPSQIRSGDKYGVVSACPAGDKEADVNGRSWDQRVEAMRDAMIYFKNSPSVIFWEAGNNAVTAAHQQEMTDLKNTLDPNGERFCGCRTISSTDQIQAADYVGTMLNRHASNAKASMAAIKKYVWKQNMHVKRLRDVYGMTSHHLTMITEISGLVQVRQRRTVTIYTTLHRKIFHW